MPPDGVTFCYPIPADPLVFHDPGTEKAAATQSDNGLMYPPGWNLWTRYARVIVFTNSCQALILRLPAVQAVSDRHTASKQRQQRALFH